MRLLHKLSEQASEVLGFEIGESNEKTIDLIEKLNKDFIKNLTEKLLEWTGERWIISLSKNSEAKSVYEKNIEAKNNFIDEFKKGKIAKEIETAFPDAKLIDIEED